VQHNLRSDKLTNQGISVYADTLFFNLLEVTIAPIVLFKCLALAASQLSLIWRLALWFQHWF